MTTVIKRQVERLRRWSYAARDVVRRFSLRLEFSPREWWLVHWRGTAVREWPPGRGPMVRKRLDVWFRLVPCAPVHLSFTGPARPVAGTLATAAVLVVARPEAVQAAPKAVTA